MLVFSPGSVCRISPLLMEFARSLYFLVLFYHLGNERALPFFSGTHGVLGLFVLSGFLQGYPPARFSGFSRCQVR